MSKTVVIGFAVLLQVAAAAGVRAGQLDDRTVLTFSTRFEIPGHVLPAGTYIFKVADSQSDRHVVQVLNADGSKIIAMFLAIPDYRLQSTADTVITFDEAPAGSPQPIRAWFYPGSTAGQEFVYPKQRAVELAVTTRTVVPAVSVETDSIDVLRTAPIIAVTPERSEVPVAAVIQTTPRAETRAAGAPSAAAGGPSALEARVQPRSLPQTASVLPLLLMFGCTSVLAGLCLTTLGGKRATVSIR